MLVTVKWQPILNVHLFSFKMIHCVVKSVENRKKQKACSQEDIGDTLLL